MRSQPYFSVLIPLYNVEGYVGRTLESVLKQEFDDFEVIVIDDGSSDGSAAVVEKFEDPRIRLIKQENSGVSAARNRAMQEANGRYFAFLDSDDYWYPDHLKRAYVFFEKHRECLLYVGRYKEGSWEEAIPRCDDSDKDAGIVNYFYSGFREIQTSVFIVESECAKRTGGFDKTLKFGEDVLYWYKLALNAPLMGLSPVATGIYMKRKNSAVNSEAHKDFDVTPLYLSFREMGKNSPNPPLKYPNVALRFMLVQWIAKSLLNAHKRLCCLVREDKRILGLGTVLSLKMLMSLYDIWRILGRFLVRRMKNYYMWRAVRWSRKSVREILGDRGE